MNETSAMIPNYKMQPKWLGLGGGGELKRGGQSNLEKDLRMTVYVSYCEKSTRVSSDWTEKTCHCTKGKG